MTMHARRAADAPPPQPPDGHASHHVDLDEWFRRRGMPSVTRARPGLRPLLRRAAPALIAFALFSLALSVSMLLLRELDPDVHAAFAEPETVLPRWYYAALATGIAIALVAGIVANRHIRRRPPDDPATRSLAAAVPLALLLMPFVDAGLGEAGTPVADLVINALLILLTLLVIRSGLGAVVAWSLRQALSQGSALSSMAARALPMIVLVTIFAFLSEGLWRVSGALSRDELWLVVLILLWIAAIFIWTVIRSEMRQVTEHPRCSPEELRAHGYLAGPAELAAIERPARLTRRESLNALVILFIAQAIQVGFLVVLVFVFFCVFGAITVPPSVMTVWTGHDPTPGVLLGMRLPISDELIQTSLFLAAFSSVSFAAASVTDPAYRQSFFEPILRDMRVTVAARNLYRASMQDAGEASSVERREPAPASGG